MDDIPRNRWYRFFEILPGAISWIILIAPIALSFRFPKAVAIFITVYVVLWFLRSMKQSGFLIYAYFKNKKYEKIDWNHLLKFFSDQKPPVHTDMEKETAERVDFLRAHNLFKASKDILHVVIIPTYKEEKEILESSVSAILEVDFPLDRVILVLATEERDSRRAEENAKYIAGKFAAKFGQFHHVMHPANLPDELPAKGANITYACRKIAQILKEQNVDYSNVLVTTLDADNRPHPAYFANLTYHYLMEPERYKRSYQPLACFYNNIWDVPFANRIVALANTFWFLAESGEPTHLFNAAAYAQSLDTLSAVDFWSRHTIVEDLHQFWRTYFHFRGDHEVVPLFIPVYQDALQNRTYFTSLVGQYKQLRRWAYGAAEIPYIALKMWKHRRHLPLWSNFSRLTHHLYLAVTWATAPIIILLNKLTPEVINPRFSHSLFAYNLSSVLGVIFTLMLIGILISIWISMISLPRPRGRFGKWQFVSGMLQWILLPFVTIIYGAIPAIDAQTRLMLNKRLDFVVTEKTRKREENCRGK